MAFINKLLAKRPALLIAGIAGGAFVLVLAIIGLVAAPKPAAKEVANSSISSQSDVNPGAGPTAAGTTRIEPTLNVVNPMITVVGNALAIPATNAAVQKAQYQKFQEQLDAVISKPFTVTAGDQNWKVTPAQLKKMVWIGNGTLDIDRGGFAELVKTWGKSIEKKPVNAQVAWSDKESRVIALKPSAPGQKVNLETSLDAIKAAVAKGENQAALVVEKALPQVDSEQLDKLGIKEKISEGLSGFAGSEANRAKNILVGADFLDNTLVAPHGAFSFNNAIGPITKERGYADGYAIVGDKTEKDVGGGICQVSTTTFRAAFWAGFNVTERNAHAYRVTWYESLGEPAGFDATIYQPGADFQFTNDTDNWLLVSTYVQSSKLRVVFYGTKPDWKVEMTPGSGDLINVTTPPPTRYEVDPKLPPGAKTKVDSAHKGFDTSIGRVITGSDGQVMRKDTFKTRYQAWPDTYKIGPTPAPEVPVSPKPSTAPVSTAPAPETSKAPAATTPPVATTPPANPTAPAATTPAPAKPTTPAATTPPAAAPGNNEGTSGSPAGTPPKS